MTQPGGKRGLREIYREQNAQVRGSSTSKAFRVISPLVIFLVSLGAVRFSSQGIVAVIVLSVVLLGAALLLSHRKHRRTPGA